MNATRAEYEAAGPEREIEDLLDTLTNRGHEDEDGSIYAPPSIADTVRRLEEIGLIKIVGTEGAGIWAEWVA